MAGGGDSYATKMYLIPPTDYNLLQECKRKETTSPPPATDASTAATTDGRAINDGRVNSNTNEPASSSDALETGTGKKKKNTEADMKRFNQNFIQNQNIKKFLENRQWAELYKRILPLVKKSERGRLSKTAPELTEIVDGESLLNLEQPTRMYDTSEEEDDGEMSDRSMSRASSRASRARSSLSSLWSAPKINLYDSDELPTAEPARRPVSPSSTSSANLGRTNVALSPFGHPTTSSTPRGAKNKRSDYSRSGTSPFPPAQSTRNRKRKRKNNEEEPEVGRGSTSGKFQKFKGWSSLKLS